MGDTKKRKLFRSSGDLEREAYSTGGHPGDLFHIILPDGTEIVRSQAELIATGVDSALAISEAGRRSAEERRRKNEPLYDAYVRLKAADPPMTPRAKLDRLMEMGYGNEYDPNDGDDYERKKDSLGRKIRRIKENAAK